MKAWVKFVGGKMKRGEKELLFLLPLTTKHWKLLLLFLLGTKHGNLFLLLLLATKLGSSFISFFLFKRADLDHLGLLFRHNLQLESWEILLPQPFLVGGKCLILVDGRKKENRLDVWGSFERMEVSGDNVGSLKS
jgi:hypothetical protein